MAVNKIKRGRALNALIKAGMDAALARATVSEIDLKKPFGPQIADLVEEDPELFGLDADGNEIETEEEPAEDDKPKTAREQIAARLMGKGASEFVERKTYRRPADAVRPSNASKAAREAAAHLVKNSTRNTPPVRKWSESGPRDLNANGRATAAPPRQRPASADSIAAKLRR